MRSKIYGPDHEALRTMERDFVERRAKPHVEGWEKQCRVNPASYREAGNLGRLGLQVPEEFGGGGQTSFAFNVVIAEEMIAAHPEMSAMRVHTGVVLPNFLTYADVSRRSGGCRTSPRAGQ